jgi:UDP-glucose 4-epimerase
VEYVQGDVRDQALMGRLAASADAVLHLAATVSIPQCQENPVESYSNNVMGTVAVLEACRRSPRKPRFALASTAAIYGALGDDGRALTEDLLPAKFLSYYAAQKHAAEKAAQLYCEHHGVPSLIFRFFNVFGKGQDPASPYSGVITIFLDRAKRAQPLRVNGDGLQTRDFIHVDDLTAACAASLGKSTSHWDGRVLNLGTGRAITINALAEAVGRAYGIKAPLERGEPRTGDVRHSRADISAAMSLLGTSFERDVTRHLQDI